MQSGAWNNLLPSVVRAASSCLGATPRMITIGQRLDREAGSSKTLLVSRVNDTRASFLATQWLLAPVQRGIM